MCSPLHKFKFFRRKSDKDETIVQPPEPSKPVALPAEPPPRPIQSPSRVPPETLFKEPRITEKVFLVIRSF